MGAIRRDDGRVASDRRAGNRPEKAWAWEWSKGRVVRSGKENKAGKAGARML